MTEHTWDSLHKLTVTKLRQIAKELDYEELHGYRTMHKEQLLPALCHALGIEDHAHHEIVGIDKTAVKARIRELKTQRDAAIAVHDSAELKRIRRRIHRLKRRLHRATV